MKTAAQVPAAQVLAREQLDALQRRLESDPVTARAAHLARPWIRLAGHPERLVEQLDAAARHWRAIREESEVPWVP